MDVGRDLTAEVDMDAAPADLHDPRVRHDVEQGLAAVEGVLSARIVPGFGRPVDELHVVASDQRDVKPLIRDVQSLLMARYGIATDHRVISVVQLDERDRAEGEPRVVMSGVSVTHEGLSVRAEVTVRRDDDEFHGSADGPASASGRRRATGRAALEALRPLIAAGQVVEIEGVDVAQVLGHEVALCLVHFHTRGGEATTIGSALVVRDESDAIARAVLDALNRMLTRDPPAAQA